MIGEGESWVSKWGGSKAELSGKVRAYADSIRLPYSEVMLTLLHAAIQDIVLLDRRNRHLRGLFENFGAELGKELDRRGWSQSELSKRSYVSKGTISSAINHTRNVSMATAREIIRALEERS